MAIERVKQYHVKTARDIISRITSIHEGDAAMVVARREDGFQIGYEGTAWANHVKTQPLFVGVFDHTTEPETLGRLLRGGE